MRKSERFPYPRPPARPLKIYAFDPMTGVDARTRISVDTRNEPLEPGPLGARIAVVDYDPVHRCFYEPVDLDDRMVLMQGGIEQSESDPRFHQQMVYAVASRILEIFDRALGRPIDLAASRRGAPRPLRLYPHAFADANAFYHDDLGAIIFGYFRASAEDPGANMPGQLIFSCLSHDIVAHELTHALIHSLAPRMLRGQHPDTPALHEALADLVPMLHRFSFDEVVGEEVRRTRGKLEASNALTQVAPQFAAALGLGHGLRNARQQPNRAQYTTVLEPHERGTLLLSAVFDAMFSTYAGRTRDLLEIAGGPGDGAELHPDLVGRLAAEASKTALSFLTMCIRAFDYLPPTDVTFGDFLRAVVTADREMVPEDPKGLRAALIEAFRARGIYATGARSLAEESLVWEGPASRIAPMPEIVVRALTRSAQAFRRIRPEAGEQAGDDEIRGLTPVLQAYARRNARALHLSAEQPIRFMRPRHSFRVAPDGQLIVEIIAQFYQRDLRKNASSAYRGTTIVAAADGTVRYVIPNQPAPRLKPPPETPVAPEAQAALLRRSRRRGPSIAFPFAARYRLAPARYRKLHAELARLADTKKLESLL